MRNNVCGGSVVPDPSRRAVPRLTPRLCKIAEFVPQNSIVADVGTDHAYLPVYLVQRGICPWAYASDIGEGPLQSARKAVELYGLSDRIELIRCDGLNGVPPRYETLIIAGMGGDLIARILAENPPFSGVRMILQPMTAHEELRRFLYENSYRIVREEIVCEGDKLYTVMVVLYGSKLVYSELDTYVSPVLCGSEPGIAYMKLLISKLEKQIAGLRRSSSDHREVISHCESLIASIAERMASYDNRL